MPLKTVSGKHADPRKGRGAGINPEGRFEAVQREAFDDGWTSPEEEELPPLKTQVTIEHAKSIISHNDSPDVGFSQSLNPYAGCEHGCSYCMDGETPILLASGRTRLLAKIQVGDEIYGTVRSGWYRRYVRTRVSAHWSVIKPAYKITLEDETQLIASGDHRFFTERGWKFVTGTMQKSDIQRPYLTTNNKLMGTGGFASDPVKDEDYKRGYLCGMIRGDANLRTYIFPRPGGSYGVVQAFRLALCDGEALLRAHGYLYESGIQTSGFLFQEATSTRRAMRAIRASGRCVEDIQSLITWPDTPTPSWSAGFLAGIFDAEGSYSQCVLRISNTDHEIIERVSHALRGFGFRFTVEDKKPGGTKPIKVVRLDGGLCEQLRFFHSVDPAITRKLNIEGQAVKSNARLNVVSVEPLGKVMRLFDITTETGDFIANGVVSHNCFARPSHAYRNLSPGIDFETRIFAKVNAAELLRKELSRPGYRCEELVIGVNTDAYQPIERELKITRSVLEVCAEFNQPVSLITKNATIERDIDILSPMAGRNLVAVSVSCNNLDHEIARRLEPRCVAPRRRLEVMRNLSEAGIPVSVLVAPVIPFLTDDQIEPVLEAAWAHGARQAGYVLLRLPWEVKDLFKDWLERHYPLKANHVMSRVHAMRQGRDNDPCFGSRMVGDGKLAELLKRRFEIASRRIGFNERHRELDTARFRPPSSQSQLTLF